MGRYHLVKVAIVALMIGVAVVGSSVNTSQAQHGTALAPESPYSAAIQLQATSWCVATTIGRAIRHIILRT